ncbi:ABC-type dipeptide/oligopeptide/nickel transport system ATPase component [Bradyrhizobium sp. USDA 4473]
MTAPPLIEVENLRIDLDDGARRIAAVEGVSFRIDRGETFGLVGESGCGKSITALALIGLLRRPLSLGAGAIRFDGREIQDLPAAEQRTLRGNRIAMIFQEPMTALNPVSPIGRQIAEMFVLHQGKSWRDADRLAVEALASVRVPAPERRVRDYPHQLSGGMRQRVMVAIALACGPDLLIADEPTTALDVTVQAEIIELMRNLCAERGTAILMISHDLGLVANVCRRVAVMYAGRIVEERGLGRAVPRIRASLHQRPGRLAAAARHACSTRPEQAQGDRGRRAGDRGFPGRLPVQSALHAGDRDLPDHRAGDDTARRRRARQVPSPCMTQRTAPATMSSSASRISRSIIRSGAACEAAGGDCCVRSTASISS